jgi:hypothetical protein
MEVRKLRDEGRISECSVKVLQVGLVGGLVHGLHPSKSCLPGVVTEKK